MAKTESKNVQITTGIGTLCFPHLSKSQAEANKNDKGEPRYDVQIIIPKSQREDLRAIFKAIKEVGESKWGDKWKQVRNPLRDGDAEKDELTEDGSTKGEKYPERLGCYFINARSSKPVGVYDRSRDPLDPDEVYAGCKGKINIGFYAYSTSGNHGIGAGLNGVQKVAEGEALGGGGKPPVESMFDVLDEDDDTDLDLDADDVEETPAPAKKAAAKKTAKKAAPKKKAAPVEDIDVDEDADEDDLYDDLDG